MSKNRLIGKMITVGSVCVLLGCIALLSRDVGQPLTNLYGDPVTELTAAGFRAQRFAGVATSAFTTYYEANSALMSYGTGALVLVGLMLRSSRSI